MERLYSERALLKAYALLIGIDLVITLVSIFVSSAGSRVGSARSLGSIPEHLGLIFGLASVLAIGVVVGESKLDFGLILSIPIMGVLVDIDHLPSFLGIAQPIRPAHSFLAAFLVALSLLIVIRRADLSLASLSGFFAHLAVDAGVFPPFSPVSFSYASLSGLNIYFASAAVVSAFLAGLVRKKGRQELAKFVQTEIAEQTHKFGT